MGPPGDGLAFPFPRLSAGPTLLPSEAPPPPTAQGHRGCEASRDNKLVAGAELPPTQGGLSPLQVSLGWLRWDFRELQRTAAHDCPARDKV